MFVISGFFKSGDPFSGTLWANMNMSLFFLSCWLGNLQEALSASEQSFFQQLFGWNSGLDSLPDLVFIVCDVINCQFVYTVMLSKCSSVLPISQTYPSFLLSK